LTPTPFILYPVNNTSAPTAVPTATQTPVPPPPPPPPPPTATPTNTPVFAPTQAPPPPPPSPAVLAATPEIRLPVPLPPNAGQGGPGVDQSTGFDGLTVVLGALMLAATAGVAAAVWRARRDPS
jgi:hypothetical protein